MWKDLVIACRTGDGYHMDFLNMIIDMLKVSLYSPYSSSFADGSIGSWALTCVLLMFSSVPLDDLTDLYPAYGDFWRHGTGQCTRGGDGGTH